METRFVGTPWRGRRELLALRGLLFGGEVEGRQEAVNTVCLCVVGASRRACAWGIEGEGGSGGVVYGLLMLCTDSCVESQEAGIAVAIGEYGRSCGCRASG